MGGQQSAKEAKWGRLKSMSGKLGKWECHKVQWKKNAVRDEVELRAENSLLDFMASRSFMTWGE